MTISMVNQEIKKVQVRWRTNPKVWTGDLLCKCSVGEEVLLFLDETIDDNAALVIAEYNHEENLYTVLGSSEIHSAEIVLDKSNIGELIVGLNHLLNRFSI